MARTMCSSCGSSVEEDFAGYLRANVDGTPPMCGDCIETWIRNAPQLEVAFDGIRDALSAANRREWEAFSFDERFIRFLWYHDRGLITPKGTSGYPAEMRPMGRGAAFGDLVRLKCAKLRYEESDAITA